MVSRARRFSSFRSISARSSFPFDLFLRRELVTCLAVTTNKKKCLDDLRYEMHRMRIGLVPS